MIAPHGLHSSLFILEEAGVCLEAHYGIGRVSHYVDVLADIYVEGVLGLGRYVCMRSISCYLATIACSLITSSEKDGKGKDLPS